MRRVSYGLVSTMPPPGNLFDRRLLIVSGKGGTGKTAVATASAMAAARSGRRVLLAEIEGRDGVAGLLGIDRPGFQETKTMFGFSVLSINPREALLEYLWLFFGMRTLARTLARAKAVEVVTDGIPGFRDLMSAGKLYELTEWRWTSEERPGRPRYDLVVVDAPPTGQLLPLLRAPTAFRDLIRVGRPHRQMASIERLFRSGARLVLVAIPEEMAVEETAVTVSGLAEEGFRCDAIVANRVHPPVFPRGLATAGRKLTPVALAEALSPHAAVSKVEAEGLLAAARDADARVSLERRQLGRLDRLGPPVARLPMLFTKPFGPPEVERLAEEMGP